MSKISNIFALRDAVLALAGSKDAAVNVALSAIADAIRHAVAHGNIRPLTEAAHGLSAVKGKGKAKEATRAAFASAVASVEGMAYSAGSITDKRAKKNAGIEAGDVAAMLAAATFADVYASTYLGAESAALEAREARKATTPALVADTSEVDAAASASIADAASVIAEHATLRTLADLSDDTLRAMVGADEASAARVVAVLSAELARMKAEKLADALSAKDDRKAAQAVRIAAKASQVKEMAENATLRAELEAQAAATDAVEAAQAV